MRPIARELAPHLRAAARDFPAVVLTGPRRAGKTFCLRHTFPAASYHLLEDPDTLARVRADPRAWLDDVAAPAVIDEVQNAPELFAYIRTRIDEAPRRKGQWFLTGSQDFALMNGAVESMAGRAGVFQLLPLSVRELGRWDLLRGGYPEVWSRPTRASTWFRSYVQTYLERDVRAITAVRDLVTFRRFMTLLAARNGQVLNKTDLAAPLGVSVPTITQWLGVLEATGVVLLVPPYFENFEKRLIKTPKLYWLDVGLLCHLLGFESRAALERSTFIGAVFEAFVASEIVKHQLNRGRARELYFFRDQQGLEVDFLVPEAEGRLALVEVKWSKTVVPEMARPVQRLLPLVRSRPARAVVIHRGEGGHKPLATGVRAMTLEDFLG